MSGRSQARTAAEVHLGLGSNVGDREAHLASAVRSIAGWPEVQSLVASRLFESAFVGPGKQDPYLNACLRLLMTLSPDMLHSRARALERAAGRRERGHLQPRSLDIDILLYGDASIEAPKLKIPHPRMRERRFVLQPLVEISPMLRHPEDGRLFREELERAEIRAQACSVYEAPTWKAGAVPTAGAREGRA